MSYSSQEFSEFRDFLKQFAGISLAENKQYLVATRVRKIIADNSFSGLSELTRTVKKPSESRLRQKVIDAMTTNETFWFRDIYPFDYLKNTIFPSYTKKNAGGTLRLWSAACSSGQEPYSISIMADEFNKSLLGKPNLKIDIQATDLSSRILDTAKSGRYDKLSISRGMASARLNTYFDEVNSKEWALKNNIKSNVSFRSLNLKDSFASLGKFDVIFCRNVLIYFAPDLKADILRRMHAALVPGGFLFLGSSENPSEVSDLFSMINCQPGIVYQAR